ncbi:MAG: hypothetical protein AAGA15_09525 [Pseudomonadota bacterium]
MVGNSKVLTVSYGTFSCTLEGFDDSFDTMKAIAEYFRDLAAEDRYFGAEPPQPDAEVLARIAERELARGVQARTDGHAVLLKPTEAEAPTEAQSEALTEAPVPVEEALAERDEPAEEATGSTESDPAAEAEAPEITETIQDQVAEQTEEEIEVDGEPAESFVEAVAEDEVEAEQTVEETLEPVDLSEETSAEDLASEEDPASDTDDTDGDEAAQVEEELAETREQVEEEIEEQDDEEAEPLAAAELQESDEAAFFQGAASADDDAFAYEDEDELTAAAPESDRDSELANDPLENTAASIEEEAVTEPEEELGAVAVDEPEAEPVEEAIAEDVEVEDKPADNSLAAKLRRIQAVVGAASAGVAARAAGRSSSDYTEDEHAEDFSQGAEAEADSDVSTPAEESAEATVTPETEGEDRPRVLKMRRADFEAAMAHEQAKASEQTQPENLLDEDDEDDEVTSIFAETEVADAVDEADLQSTLSPEDEADLMAELAAAEAEARAETGETSEAHPVEAEDAPDAEESDEASQQSPISFEDSDTAMGRLMDEAQAKLEEPENKTRREAYSHLKAAVAAKQASRDMGEDDAESSEKREGDYRADLAKVVRPRRAAKPENGERTRRPAPAPLKLVASQRVDLPEDAEPTQSEPVRPRRIAKQDEAIEASAGSFAAFATRAGADELPDVLEAAASYLTHAEGHAAFSRPQVMRIVQQALPQGSFTREDGLRAFGTLLRQNRLKKVRGGQFEVTETTGFQPEARELRAAG